MIVVLVVFVRPPYKCTYSSIKAKVGIFTHNFGRYSVWQRVYNYAIIFSPIP